MTANRYLAARNRHAGRGRGLLSPKGPSDSLLATSAGVVLAALALAVADFGTPLAAQEAEVQARSVRLQVREAELDPEEVPAGFRVELAVSVDGAAAPTRRVDGRDAVVLQNGQRISVEVRSERAGSIRIFYHNAKGELIQLLPNQFDGNGSIAAGQPLVVGGPDGDYDIVVEPPLGAECLAVIVSTRPFTDEAEIAELLKTRTFLDLAAADVSDAAEAVTRSVRLAPREALVGAALLHIETE